jgi:hypothetical protein
MNDTKNETKAKSNTAYFARRLIKKKIIWSIGSMAYFRKVTFIFFIRRNRSGTRIKWESKKIKFKVGEKENFIINLNIIRNLEHDFSLEVATDIFHDLVIPTKLVLNPAHYISETCTWNVSSFLFIFVHYNRSWNVGAVISIYFIISFRNCLPNYN